jgi:1-acyl-sn-glycerol-3-phosphate acyltransferase
VASGCAGGVLLGQLPDGSRSWLVLAGVVLAVFLVLPPWAGALVDRLGGRRFLVAAAALSLAAVALWCVYPGAWPGWLGCLAASAALNGPARDVLVAVAAREARLALTRVVCAMRLAMVGGAAAGLALTASPGEAAGPGGLPAGAGVAALAYLLALLCTLPVHFPAGGTVRTESPAGGGFVRHIRRLLAHPDTCDPLLAMAALVALVLLGGVLAYGLWPTGPALALLSPACLGAAVGAVLAAAQPHPSRVLALVPMAVTGMLGGLLWRAHLGPTPCPAIDAALGMLVALAAAPLSASYLVYLPAEARGRGVAWAFMSCAGTAALALALLLALDHLGLLATAADRFGVLAALAVAALLAAWWAFFRDVAEQVAEWLLRPCYRLRVHGPGLADFPLRGPVLVLANHSAWLDGVWLAAVLPRRVVPLMISLFYDRPVLHWLMSRVVRAIRVQDAPYRREAPELEQAVAALERGDCVLMFPEGVLRRKDDVTLRHFGQGVWRILRERPDTPVVVCWIEGGWGSFTSHRGGPPVTGKRLDWRRPIDIALETAQILDPAVLADQQATRRHLEQACLDARRHLARMGENGPRTAYADSVR